VFRHNSLGPKEILVEDGKAVGVVFKKCLSVYDEEGQFAPVFDDSELSTVMADTVIVAVGQMVDLSFLEGASDIEVSSRGLVVIDPDTQMTSAPGVFMAGDAAYGTKLLIDAQASGKRVARAAFTYLTGNRLKLEKTESHTRDPEWSREIDFEKIPRTPVPTAPPESRVHSVSLPVEYSFDEQSAVLESSRCLDCGVNTIFDGDKCILCGGCVDVCPQSCLTLVPVSSLEGDEGLDRLMEARFDDHPLDDASAIIKDEDECIRCGLCVERCPTGAISMERFTFSETWHVC
jgi:ferredoxin